MMMRIMYLKRLLPNCIFRTTARFMNIIIKIIVLIKREYPQPFHTIMQTVFILDWVTVSHHTNGARNHLQLNNCWNSGIPFPKRTLAYYTMRNIRMYWENGISYLQAIMMQCAGQIFSAPVTG